jgi:hypothetical protein
MRRLVLSGRIIKRGGVIVYSDLSGMGTNHAPN